MNLTPAPPPIKTSPPPPAKPSKYAVTSGRRQRGQKVLIYGSGGVGKSTLATKAPSPLFIDCDNGGTDQLDVRRITVKSFAEVRGVLADDSVWDGVGTAVLDSGSGLVELACADLFATKLADKDSRADSIESYGYGKGHRFLYDRMNLILGDLERHANAGRNVVIIAHDMVRMMPNPMGDDFKAYRPNLPDTDKASVADRVKAFVDEVWYVQSDKSVNKGKATDKKTRSIYVTESPIYMAKTRSLDKPVYLFDIDDCSIWTDLLQGATK